MFRNFLKNLKPGEAVIIIDYKMKLELSMHAREIQKDWGMANVESLFMGSM